MVLSTTGLKSRSEGVPYLWVWMEVIFSALFLHKNNCCVRLNTDMGFCYKNIFHEMRKGGVSGETQAVGLRHAFPIFSHMNEICELWQNVQNTTHLLVHWLACGGPALWLYLACKFFTFFPQYKCKQREYLSSTKNSNISIATKPWWEKLAKFYSILIGNLLNSR